MALRDSLFFTFNDRNCKEFGVINVNVNGGMLEELFSPNKAIRERKIKGNSKPYYMGVDYEPLEFSLTLAFEDSFDTKKLSELDEWLNLDDYAPLIFENKTSHIYYAMITSEGVLFHNSNNQGYITFTLRCDSPWAYTPAYTTYYDFSDNTESGAQYVFMNPSDFDIKPLLIVEMVSGNSFSIINNSYSGEKLEFADLAVGETLTIDCQYGDIQTNLPYIYRYSNLTNDSTFTTFSKGYNYLTIYGSIKLTFKYRGFLRS